MSNEAETYYKEHDASPDGIYFVEIFHRGETVQIGGFSTMARATAWIETFPNTYESVIMPVTIDDHDLTYRTT
jgi:hypothetical protein